MERASFDTGSAVFFNFLSAGSARIHVIHGPFAISPAIPTDRGAVENH
jgi:hypothetical protein